MQRIIVVKVSAFTAKVISNAYATKDLIPFNRTNELGAAVGHDFQPELPFALPKLPGYELTIECSLYVWHQYNKWGNNKLERLAALLERKAKLHLTIFVKGYTANKGKITDAISTFYQQNGIDEDDYPFDTALKYIQRQH